MSGPVEGCVLAEEEALPVALPEGLPDAEPEAEPDAVSAGGFVAEPEGVVADALAPGAVVPGTAARAAHSLSITESEETILLASSRLVAVIEDCTLDCSEVGSPATVTVAEL